MRVVLHEVHTFPLKALLSEDADESEELGDLLQIKHRCVVQLDDSQRLLVVGAATAILHEPAKERTDRGLHAVRGFIANTPSRQEIILLTRKCRRHQ